MRALVLNGVRDGRDSTNEVCEVVTSTLETANWETARYTLREVGIADCSGRGGCAFKTPGLCVFPDAANEIMGKLARSDLFVLFTPLTFGGYSSQLKKVLDRDNGHVHTHLLFPPRGTAPRAQVSPAGAAVGDRRRAGLRRGQRTRVRPLGRAHGAQLPQSLFCQPSANRGPGGGPGPRCGVGAYLSTGGRTMNEPRRVFSRTFAPGRLQNERRPAGFQATIGRTTPQVFGFK